MFGKNQKRQLSLWSRLFSLAIAIMLLFGMLPLVEKQALAAGLLTLEPTDDAYVRGGAYASDNFGALPELFVKNNASSDMVRKSYLRFDLSQLDLSQITSVKFHINGAITEGTHQETEIWVFGTDEQGWNESAVTWSTQPEEIYELGSILVNRTWKWHELDVTDYVRSRMQGEGISTFVLVQKEEPGFTAHFRSKEHSQKPYLTVETTPVVEALYSEDDAYVRGGASADLNYGSETNLIVKKNTADLTREGLLKFDISGYEPAQIGSAKLHLFGAITEGSGDLQKNIVYLSEDDDWNESTVTWNDKPAPVHRIGEVNTSRTWGWHEIDVTAQLRKEAAGDGKATFAILQEQSGVSVFFRSKENSNNKPYVEIKSNLSDSDAPIWKASSQLQVVNEGKDSVSLSWPLAMHGKGVAAYRIYKQGELLQEVSGNVTAYTANGLVRGEPYTFQIQAADALGHWTTDGPYITVNLSKGEIIQTKPGNIFVQPEPAQFILRTEKPSVQWYAENYWGKRVAEGTAVATNGEAVIQAEIQEKGYFTLNILEGQAEISTPFAILSPFDQALIADSPFGFSTHLNRTPHDWEDILELFVLSGAKTLREGSSWANVEKQKGEYTFTPFPDNYLPMLESKGVKDLFVAGLTNPFYDENGTPYTEEGLEGFSNYAAAYMKQYEDIIDWVEVYNEFNLPQFGDRGNSLADSKPEYYAEMLKTTYSAIKAVRPDATVIGMVTSGMPLDWWETVFQQGGMQALDAVSFHRYPPTPEGLDDLTAVQSLMKQYNDGQTKPIWLSEFGWPTHTSVVTEDIQAKYVLRSHAVALASGLEKAIWYDLMDDGLDPADKEHHFGLVHNVADPRGRLTPKPGFPVYAAMTRELSGAEYIARDALDEGLYSYKFAKNGQDVRVMWSLAPQTIAVDADQPVEIIDMMGNSSFYTPLGGKVYLTLTSDPIYLKGTLSAIGKDASFLVSAVDTVVGEAVHAELQVNNPTLQAETFVFESGDASRAIQAGPSETASASVNISGILKEGTCQLSGTWSVNGTAFGFSIFDVHVLPSHKVEVLPWMEQPGINEGQLNIRIFNHASSTLLGVEAIEWQLGSSSGREAVEATVAPQSNLPVPLEVGAIALAKSYPYRVKVFFADNSETVLEGNIEFNPLYQLPILTDGTMDKGLPGAMVDLATGVNKITGYGGSGDLSGQAWVTWDEDNLYLSASIIDDVFAHPSAGSEIWKNDSLQFAVAQGMPGTENKWYEFTLSQTSDGPLLYRSRAPEGSGGKPITNRQLAIIRDEANAVTAYELAIPWSELAPIIPKIESVFSFSFLVNDNDGAGRKGFIEWGAGIGGSKDPGLFRPVFLMPPAPAPMPVTGTLAASAAELQPGQPLELTVGVDHASRFTAADVTVHYDPDVLEFATDQVDGVQVLKDEAIQSQQEGYQVSAAVYGQPGKLRALLFTAGPDRSLAGTEPLFKLRAAVKESAELGVTAAVYLSGFELSFEGEEAVVPETAGARVSLLITAQPLEADITALNAAIAYAQTVLDNAVVGPYPGQYPQAAYDALAGAIGLAQAVRDQAGATQAAVDQAAAALQTAVQQFFNAVNPASPGQSADFTALNAAIAKGQKLHDEGPYGDKIGTYPESAKTALKTALDAAKAIRGNSSASQEAVNAAVTALNGAIQTFEQSLITLVGGGATKVGIRDLSLVAKYYGITHTHPDWSKVAAADIKDGNEITIEVLAAVARMILTDWAVGE